MSRGRSTFRQRDLTAAVKAVIAAGCEVVRVKVDKAGTIVLETSKASVAGGADDDDLDRELAEFEARHGEG